MTDKVCTITWTEDDVLQIANQWETEITLTETEIEQILESMSETYDADLGITWDTVAFWIDCVLDEREKSE